MSYILEALKKAEAEREKGSVPGLRSHAWSANTPEANAKPWFSGRWLALAMGLSAVGGGGLWWGLLGVGAEHSAPMTKAPEQGATLPPAPQVLAASQGLVPQPAPTAPMPSTAQSPAASITAAQIPTKPKLAKHHAPAASASEGILKWADLPPVERDKLPKLHWGGGMYSPDPSARMVIINEQVMREGDALGAGLVLERIEAKALVLNRKGQRIRWDIGRE